MNSSIRASRRVAFALLAVCLSAMAQAIPIVFEFSGTVSEVNISTWGGGQVGYVPGDPGRAEYGRLGQAFSATISVDTADLTRQVSVEEALFYSFPNTGLDAFSTQLAIGGEQFAIDVDAGTNFGNIRFESSLLDPNCFPVFFCPSEGGPDLFHISDGSYDAQRDANGGLFGTVHHRALSFNSTATQPLILGEGFDPLNALTQPLSLAGLNFFYTDTLMNCFNACEILDTTTTYFSLATLDRRVATPTQVPEPGTLGLLLCALAALPLARRQTRKPATS